MRDELPFMSFAVDRWLSDSAHLTDRQYRIAHRLLCHAWKRGGALPSEPAVLARMIGEPEAVLAAEVAALETWFHRDGGTLIAQTVADEYTRALNVRDAKRRGAQATNAKRWKSHSESESESLIDSQKDSTASRPSPSPHTAPDRETSHHTENSSSPSEAHIRVNGSHSESESDSESESQKGSDKTFSVNGRQPLKSPSPGGTRRNGDFERINHDVLRLITEACFEPDDPSKLAQVLHITVAQARTSIAQLRDRGTLKCN